MAIGQSRGGHRERVLIDGLLLELLDILVSPQGVGRRDIAHDRQTHRQLSSVSAPIHRIYRSNVRNLEAVSRNLAGCRTPSFADFRARRALKHLEELAGIEIG